MISKKVTKPIRGLDDYLEACNEDSRRAWLEARTLIVDRFADLNPLPDEDQVPGGDFLDVLTSLFVTHQIKVNGGHNDEALDDFVACCSCIADMLGNG